MSKFSVKKPLTVFVAVVIVVVLGFVSYSRMTPTLMPNMDLPYVIITTTYVGASPEKVETTVSKPMEESMATLENIENVSSTSSENYSLLILEFQENANLDTATIDILQKVEVLQASWDDMVGSPYILKINPDMLPVTMAAVDMEGMDTAELSAFVEDELLNKMEGIDGVASVTPNGLLEEQVNVEIKQDKIDKLNKKIKKAINSQFAEAEKELQDGKNELESQQNKIDSGKSQVDSGANEMAGQLAEAEGEMNKKKSEVQEGKAELKTQIKELKKQLEEMEGTEKTLKELQENIKQLESAVEGLTAIQGMLDAQPGLTVEMLITMLEGTEYKDLIPMLKGMSNADVAKSLAEAQAGLSQIDSSLAQMGIKRADIPKTLKEITSGKAQVKAGIASLEAMMKQLEEGGAQLDEAMKEVSKQKTLGILNLSNTSAQMIAGESTIASALESMKEGEEQIKEAKKAAKSNADLNDIITMEMVSNILTAQNFSMPAGQLEEDGVKYMVSVGDEFEAMEDMEDMMLFDLGMDDVDPIYLTDVADIVKTDNSEEIYAKVNGNNGVILSFSKQSNGATADVSDRINDKFKELEKEHKGLSFTNLMDQGDYIHMIVDTIMQNLILGAVFAVLILFLFLKDLRPTVITLVSIPISVLFAIVLMYFSGVTLNLLSLSGLAVAVGMLVDNSVVVIENIYRLRYKGASAVKAAVSGAAQVAGAIAASTLTTICVFMPIVFVDGLTKQLFVDFALTFGYSLLASLIVAMTLVPAMSSGMLVKEPKEHRERLMNKLLSLYRLSIKWALKYKLIVLAGSVALLILSFVLVVAKGFSFMPDMGSDTVSVSLEMPEGSSFEDTTKMSDEAVEKIQEVKGVGTVGAMMSSGMSVMSSMGGGSDDNAVSMYVLLDEKSSRTSQEIANDINKACEDLDCELTASGSSTMDMSAMMSSGVSINLYSDDLEELQNTAKEVAEVLEGVKGIEEVSDGMEDANPGIRFVVDKEKAMKEGLTVAQVYQEISEALTQEKVATNITEGTNGYDVAVLQGTDTTLEDIKNYKFTVEEQDGEKTKEKEISIQDIAKIEDTETMNSISRAEHKRYMSVTGDIKEGKNITLVSNDVEKALKKYDVPDGVTVEFSGENEEIMDAMIELMKMLGLGILFVYLVMVAQFQSLKSPFIIMFTIPLAFTGGLLALLLTGQEISVISLIGFVMLVGIIVNNGIVLVDYINQLRMDGREKRKAIIEAGVTRMRPILMTSLTTILGLSVTALSSGSGSDMMRPIAIVCIGGLLYATILTMYVVPCLYDVLNRKEFRTIDDDDLIITKD